MHEEIVVHESEKLSAIIAIHNTRQGPALGGCRLWPYSSPEEAMEDAKRLSEGMSFKNYLAGIPFGGGKSVIIADPKDKSDEMMIEMGKLVESLKGKYYIAEDVNTTPHDMQMIHKSTEYVRGLTDDANPSPATAAGVLVSIMKVKKLLQLNLKRVAIQGVGSVGYALARSLHANGIELVLSDINEDRLHNVCQELNAIAVPVEEIHKQDVDILAPCALGGSLNTTSIPEIQARAIVGSANNQLATSTDGDLLHSQGIFYAPDYIVNSGGVVYVAMDYSSLDEMGEYFSKLQNTINQVYDQSVITNVPPHKVAEEMAIKGLNV